MPSGKREPLETRFWRFVEKTDSCWNWAGGKAGNGYGCVGAGDGSAYVLTHRAAWMLTNGPIPDGMWVLHTCDNRLCVNPDHLYLGDRSQNMKDAHERGRIDLKRVASFPRPGRRKQARY